MCEREQRGRGRGVGRPAAFVLSGHMGPGPPFLQGPGACWEKLTAERQLTLSAWKISD